MIAGGSIGGILYAILFGNGWVGEAGSGENLGLIPFLHEGTSGMVAGGLLVFALAVVLSRVARKKVA